MAGGLGGSGGSGGGDGGAPGAAMKAHVQHGLPWPSGAAAAGAEVELRAQTQCMVAVQTDSTAIHQHSSQNGLQQCNRAAAGCRYARGLSCEVASIPAGARWEQKSLHCCSEDAWNAGGMQTAAAGAGPRSTATRAASSSKGAGRRRRAPGAGRQRRAPGQPVPSMALARPPAPQEGCGGAPIGSGGAAARAHVRRLPCKGLGTSWP